MTAASLPVYATRSGLGQVYQGDALEVLKGLEEESVDLITPFFGGSGSPMD